MRIVTFNVNGLRSIRDYFKISSGWNFDQFLASFGADILCVQETKINEVNRLEREYALPSEYIAYYAFQKGTKTIGYSGVATLCQSLWKPVGYEDGFTGVFDKHWVGPRSFELFSAEELKLLDGEGRCIITDHIQFVIINAYFPNDSGPERRNYRLKFYTSVFERCKMLLEAGRSLIILGDFNVTWHPIDHCEYAGAYKEIYRRIGEARAIDLVNRIAVTGEAAPDDDPKDGRVIQAFFEGKELRRWFYKLLHTSELATRFGLRDAFRDFHGNEFGKYTCWNTLTSARGTNYGTRLDSILVAGPLFGKESNTVLKCDILPNFMGSDHCPAYIELDLVALEVNDPAMPRNLSTHRRQRRLSEFFESYKTTETKPTREVSFNITKKPKTTKSAGVKFGPFSDSQRPKIGQDNNIIERSDGDRLEVNDLAADESNTSNRNQPDWRSVFKPRPAPLCKGHLEPCRLLTVGRKGPNQGRKFYTCAKGIGPKGDPQYRCPHFEWYTKNKSTP